MLSKQDKKNTSLSHWILASLINIYILKWSTYKFQQQLIKLITSSCQVLDLTCNLKPLRKHYFSNQTSIAFWVWHHHTFRQSISGKQRSSINSQLQTSSSFSERPATTDSSFIAVLGPPQQASQKTWAFSAPLCRLSPLWLSSQLEALVMSIMRTNPYTLERALMLRWQRFCRPDQMSESCGPSHLLKCQFWTFTGLKWIWMSHGLHWIGPFWSRHHSQKKRPCTR